jgi:hypothetical protein
MSVDAIVLQACQSCTHRTVVVADDSRMTCKRCGAARGVLSAESHMFIRTVERTFGPLTEPVVLRSKDMLQAKADRHLINLEEAARVR